MSWECLISKYETCCFIDIIWNNGQYYMHDAQLLFNEQEGPGRGTPLYGLYRYVRPQRVWFFSRFGHKLGIDFSHFAAILVINRVSIFAL